MVNWWLLKLTNTINRLARSHGLVVKAEDSCSRGCGFEPLQTPYTRRMLCLGIRQLVTEDTDVRSYKDPQNPRRLRIDEGWPRSDHQSPMFNKANSKSNHQSPIFNDDLAKVTLGHRWTSLNNGGPPMFNDGQHLTLGFAKGRRGSRGSRGCPRLTEG